MENKKTSKEFLVISNIVICLIMYFLYDYIIGYVCAKIFLDENMEIINFLLTIMIIPMILIIRYNVKYSYLINFFFYFVLAYFLGNEGYMNISLSRGNWIDFTPMWMDALIFSFDVCTIQKIIYLVINKLKKFS